MPLDIKEFDTLKKYLNALNIVDDLSVASFKVLSGGVSANTVFIDVSQPLVVKQALSKLKTESDWFSDPSRITVEYKGLQWLYNNLPSGSVPKPILLDEENSLMVMEGIAPPVKNLKYMLLAEEIDEPLLASFGQMLGTIHQRGQSDPECATTFSNTDFFLNLRLEPYYEFTGKQVAESSNFYSELMQSTLDHQITVVHGDYSPKNVLVKEGRLILLDHEVMHFGDPAFDVGFSLTHVLSKANHLSNIRFVDLALLVWENYQDKFSFRINDYEQRCVHHLLGCMLARIHGKSPLEYLDEASREWQSKTVLAMMANIPDTLPEVFHVYIDALNGKN